MLNIIVISSYFTTLKKLSSLIFWLFYTLWDFTLQNVLAVYQKLSPFILQV